MNEYKNAMKYFNPTDEQKEKMFLKAEIMAEQSIYSPKCRKIIRIFAASAAVIALTGTTTVFADDIKLFFHSFFDNDRIISEDIIENIYEDSDDHIEFRVNRIISDRMNTYAIVSYTASDDIGREWLFDELIPFEYSIKNYGDKYMHMDGQLEISPDEYSSYSHGLNNAELTEPHDKNSRTFRISCHSMNEMLGTDCINLKYAMSDGKERTARIDISESAEMTDIKIESAEAADKPYIPVGVKYSSLGLTIYGNRNPEHVTDDELINIENYRIIKSDGSCIDTRLYSSYPADKEICGYELIIMTTFFDEPVDTNEIAGIWLDDIYYSLK